MRSQMQGRSRISRRSIGSSFRNTAIFALAVALPLTACGDGEDAEVSQDGTDLTDITVGVIPLAEFVPLYIAQDSGYFEDEGLDVTLQDVQDAASIAPSVMNNQFQFGTAASPPFLTGVEQGLPLIAVANAASVGEDPETDPSLLLGPSDGQIESLNDLEGKTVAVNALGSYAHVVAMGAVAEAGADPDGVTYVAMPFPEMQAAVESGTVDAAAIFEPFRTQAVEAGLDPVSPLASRVLEPGTMAVFFGAEDYTQDNPDVVEAFTSAIDRASQSAADDPQIVRDALAAHIGMDEEIVENIELPAYSDELDVEALESTVGTMEELGFLSDTFEISESVWQ